MGEVISLSQEIIRDGVRLEAEAVLKGALEDNLSSVTVVGIDADGGFHVYSTEGSAETYLLLGRAKAKFIESCGD